MYQRARATVGEFARGTHKMSVQRDGRGVIQMLGVICTGTGTVIGASEGRNVGRLKGSYGLMAGWRQIGMLDRERASEKRV